MSAPVLRPPVRGAELPDTAEIDFGRRARVLRLGPLSTVLELRSLLVVTVLLAGCLVVAVLSLGTGDHPLSPVEVLQALTGRGSRSATLIVTEWRLPRVLAALGLGAALAVSGAIFQSLTRNPLGSPDIIGFSSGAYTGALISILVINGGFLITALGALGGGIATAMAVYLLAHRRGSTQGFRLIIVGIAVAAMLGSLNTWLILKAELEDAMRVAVWGAGSLNAMTWIQVGPAMVTVVVTGVVVAALARRMRMLELGDDAARALGVGAETSRVALMVVGVLLTAVVSATAGPIGFVALAAPQLARRLAGSTGVPLVPAAAMGALLLALSDFLAQRIYPPSPLPVGVVTVSVGGLYFIWLLVREARRA